MDDTLEILRRADRVLSKCGRPVAPSGLVSVDLPAALFYQNVIPNQGTQQQPLEIIGDTTFLMRAISGVMAPTLCYVQFQFPNGRFFQQTLRQWNDVGVGSNRVVLERDIVCEPGTKVNITGDTSINNPGTDQTFSILFEGSYRWYVRPNGNLERRIIPTDLVASLPRIFATRNQNPMAPRWLSHEFPGEGEWFTYASQAQTFVVPSGGGGSNNKTQIQTDMGYEFFLSRFYYVATFADATTGTPYVRIREGSGRELCDDYVDATKISTLSLPDWWRVPPGRDILIDLSVVDSTGTGAITIQYFFEGFRRRVSG